MSPFRNLFDIAVFPETGIHPVIIHARSGLATGAFFVILFTMYLCNIRVLYKFCKKNKISVFYQVYFLVFDLID